MTKPDKPPNPNRPITNEETRAWREDMLAQADATATSTALCALRLWELLRHLTSADHLAVTITSEPLAPSGVVTDLKGSATMPPITGTIDPNSRAVLAVVPLSADNVPTALDGNLQCTFVEPAVFSIDSTNPLSIVVKVDPPADIDAQPQTHLTISDDTDSDPTLEIVFDWQKAIVTIKATQFGATVTSELIA
jgi:hypothetical protein